MYDSVREQFIAFSTEFEGRVSFMYADIKGLVSIGIGNLIDPVELALPLPFVYKSDQSSAAGQADIQTDWQRVKSDPSLAQKGWRACDAITSLMLTDDSIETLVLSKLDQFAATLRRTSEFADLDDWPADAQLGLFSMAWAMGPAFGPGWPNFRASCAAHDWRGAADNRHMNDSANPGLRPRNVANRELFLNAAYATDQGYDPTVLQYVVSGERPTIRAGASGGHVDFLQSRLGVLGYATAVGGTFDDATTSAVAAFQTVHSLSADGIVGAMSWAALGSCVPAS